MTMQHSEADLKRMTPEQIVQAQDSGELDDILGRSRFPSTGQLNPSHLGQMTSAEIKQANAEGRLADVLGTKTK